MAVTLPPPPTKAADGSYMWLDWYQKLQQYVSQGGVVSWANIDFSGSTLTDIVDRQHDYLTGLQGGTAGEHYHLTAAQWAALTAGPHNDLSGLQGGTSNQYYHLTSNEYTRLQNGEIEMRSKAGDPNTGDIASGYAAVYKNTTTNTVRLWVNDSGTMKSVTLT